MVCASDCAVVFASCTSLRCFGIIEQAEAELDKLVFSSNAALFWHMTPLAGIDAKGPGRLFSTPLAQ